MQLPERGTLGFTRKENHLSNSMMAMAEQGPRNAAGYAGGRRDMVVDTLPRGDTAATVAIASISE
jgi:hypothetical protein